MKRKRAMRVTCGEKEWPAVEVIWRDAYQEGGWSHHTTITKRTRPATITTLGWLLKDAKKHIIVAQAFSLTSGDTLANLAIPKPWIESICHLHKGKRVKP